jgi:hypothetical protein
MLIGRPRGERSRHVDWCQKTYLTVMAGARVTVHFGCAFP